MKVIIDRFEGDFAVCETEDETIINLERDKLPQEVTEGTVLNIDNNIIFIDEQETQKLKEVSKKLLDDLF